MTNRDRRRKRREIRLKKKEKQTQKGRPIKGVMDMDCVVLRSDREWLPVHSKLLDCLAYDYCPKRNGLLYSSENVARAIAKNFENFGLILKDDVFMVYLVQLAQALLALYEISISMELYVDFLTDLIPLDLGPVKWFPNTDKMARRVNWSRPYIGNDIADNLIGIIHDVSNHDATFFKVLHKKSISCLSDSDDDEVPAVDPKSHRLKRSVKKLYEQAGQDCSNIKNTVGDTDADDNIIELCYDIESIFWNSTAEVETVVDILHHYPEFKALEDELVKYAHDDIATDCLIDGLTGGSSSYSRTKEQMFLSEENTPSSSLKCILLILKETMIQLNKRTSSLECEPGFNRPEYVDFVTADDDAKINLIAHDFAVDLVINCDFGNLSKCQHVMRTLLLSMVEHHKMIRSKFLSFRQELLTNGKLVNLDPEFYDIMLYLVANVKHMKTILKSDKTSLSECVHHCQKIYEGSSVHHQLGIFQKIQADLSVQLMESVAACLQYIKCLDSAFDPKTSTAYRVLAAELEQVVRVFEDGNLLA